MPIVSSISQRLIKVFLFTIILSSCYDEDATEPILTFGKAEKGAMPYLLESNGAGLVNLLNLESFNWQFRVGFVADNSGQDVDEYIMLVDFIDRSPDNGICGIVDSEIVRISSSEFLRVLEIM